MTTEADNEPDDDPDEPALGEPDDPPDVDDDLPDPDNAPRRRGRPISASTRAAFKAAQAEVRRAVKAGELGDDLVPSHDDEPPPPPAAKPAGAAAPPPATAAVPPAAATPPPAPSLDPRVTEAHERLNLRAADLDRREAEIEARAKDVRPPDEMRDRFHDDPAGLIIELVREWSGLAADAPADASRELLADLITDLGGRALGLGVSPEVQARTEARRALRALKAHKTEAGKAEERRQKDQEAEASKSERTRAISTLGKELQAKAETYPHLASEEDPGAIVMDVIEAQHRRDGSVMRWEDAAARANEYLKNQADQWFAKRRHLYATAPAAKPVQPTTDASVSQGDPPDHRRSRTLTNADAAARPTPPVEPDDADLDQEAHRKRSLRKLRATIAAKQQQPT